MLRKSESVVDSTTSTATSPHTEEDVYQVDPCSNRISDQDAVRCALSIPEEFVPTPHKVFIKGLEVRHERIRMISSSSKPSIQNGGKEGEYRITNKGLIVRDRERKLRSAFAKYKKWDEAERCKVDKLENNRVLVNDSLCLENINHTNYVREEDVGIELDEDWRTCDMPPLPSADKRGVECEENSCRLGCVCESINKRDPLVRAHCGKPRCFFECTCQQSVLGNGDDGNIRSRLRPRVSLLNWRFMETADKDPPPANYRQLERGSAIYPRMRRVPVVPQRFRTELGMGGPMRNNFNFKESLERRKTGINRFLRKPTASVVKRDASGLLPRRVVKSSSSPVRTYPGKINKEKTPADQHMEQGKESAGKEVEQTPLVVPNLIRMIQRDGLIILMGENKLCYLTFTIRWKHPRAILYEEMEGDLVPVPWLYLPIPAHNETWIFHQVKDLGETSFVYIPEINSVIPSKALQLHMNASALQKKTMALKILWIGPDSKERCGNIYILPALPKVLVCGPFPRNQLESRFSPSFDIVKKAANVCEYLDEVASKRYMGDQTSWDNFFAQKNQDINSSLKGNVLKENEAAASRGESRVPHKVLLSNLNYKWEQEEETDTEKASSSKPSPTLDIEQDKLSVSWVDAVKLLSVQP